MCDIGGLALPWALHLVYFVSFSLYHSSKHELSNILAFLLVHLNAHRRHDHHHLHEQMCGGAEARIHVVSCIV